MAWGSKRQTSAEADKITQLRKAGDLKGAYSEARAQFARGNREDTFMQAYTWVLHDCLKRYLTEGTKFYKDIAAFCSTLSQIRKFPVRQDRDDLFIENVLTKTRKVGWDLKKNNDTNGLFVLAAEICQWPRSSFMFCGDIARMLLVSTKDQPSANGPVLNWLGANANDWSQIYSRPAIEHIARQEQGGILAEAVAWALYDDMKRASESNNGAGNLKKLLNAVNAMGAINHTISSNHGALELMKKKVVSTGWSFRDTKNQTGIETLLNEITRWPKETILHSSDVLVMLMVCTKESPELTIAVAEWYGLENLSSADFAERVVEEKSYPSTAQELAKAYLDALLANKPDGSSVASIKQKNDGCNAVARLLSQPKCSNWIWESYNLGKLQLEMGETSEARKRFALLVASKPKEAWSWAAYGRSWEHEDFSKYEACLFKGLAVSRDLSTSLSVHEDAARIFEKRGMFPEARTEVDIVANYRQNCGWRPTPFTDEARTQDWYREAISKESNHSAYQRFSVDAEDIVATDLPWTDFYVEWKNEEKQLVGFVTAGNMPGTYIRHSTKDEKLVRIVHVGVVYSGHFGFENRSLIGPVEANPKSLLNDVFIGTYDANLDLVKNFAFARADNASVWIAPKLLENGEPKQFQNVSGSCRRVYKEPKKPFEQARWEWEAMTLVLGSMPDESWYRSSFTGTLDIAHNRRQGNLDFGFAAGCYIPKEVIAKHRLDNGDKIDFVAEKNWDSRKKQWGWSATEITDVQRIDYGYDEDYSVYTSYDERTNYEDPYENDVDGKAESSYYAESNWADIVDGKFQS